MVTSMTSTETVTIPATAYVSYPGMLLGDH